MLKNTQLDPEWEKKFDPPTIDKLPRMKWQQVVERMFQFFETTSCHDCPAEQLCSQSKDDETCTTHLTAWAKSMMRSEWQ